MPIPSISRASIERALELLIDDLPNIRTGRHDSTKYDLLWNGERFPPKVVVSRAVTIEHGYEFPEGEFSGGEGAGQANQVLRKLGFQIISKTPNEVALPLKLHDRFGRKEIFATQGISYDQQQQHLNTGLSPRCPDGGYMIFVTLDKDELDPSHDYEDALFAESLIWVSRRGVTLDHPDYVNLADANTRVSVFVRNQPREKFAYLGEATTRNRAPIIDGEFGRPQLRYIWNLAHIVPDSLLQELTLGVYTDEKSKSRTVTPRRRSRMPSTFDEFRKAYSYATGAVSDRLVVPEHQRFQVQLARFLSHKNVAFEMERDFVDVVISLQKIYIGEIKVTRNLTVAQAFRAALGQVIEYAYILFEEVPAMIIFLDQELDAGRLKIASAFRIAAVALTDGVFKLQNPEIADAELARLFSSI
jgi:hypothetical protein